MHVLLGKQDAVKMKECIDSVESPEILLNAKLNALEDLELLVESLDNANGMFLIIIMIKGFI